MQSFILKNNESETARLRVLQDADIDRVAGGDYTDAQICCPTGTSPELTIVGQAAATWDCE